MQITIEPKSVQDYIPEWYDILIYGGSGTGKTEFVGSFADAGEVLTIDTDGGILTQKTSPRLAHKDRLHFIDLSSSLEGYETNQSAPWLIVHQVINDLASKGSFGKLTPRTVALDSLTTVAACCMKHVLVINKRPFGPPQYQDWGKQMELLRELILTGRRAKMNFICVAHEQYDRDEISGKAWCLPLVTGKLAGQIGAHFDEVYNTYVVQAGLKREYKMHTKPTGLVTAKSRFDLASPVDTNYSSLKGCIENLQQP
uniref:Putative ATPase domain containing protein n=1 Tax=viral metagenome TaxID=1070528 RepID=A0A6M3L8R6_9ZZZZ